MTDIISGVILRVWHYKDSVTIPCIVYWCLITFKFTCLYDVMLS